MHDSGKSDGADRTVVIATSRWSGLLVFLLVVLLLLLGRFLLIVAASQWLGQLVFLVVLLLLLGRLLLGRLLP
jgi:hypothetical protein